MELTKQDLDVLIEAVESWESKDAAGEMAAEIMTAMISRSKEDYDLMQSKRSVEKASRERERRTRKDRSIVLRAKLIQIRDSIEASDFVDEARGQARGN
jgi:hypothetical protein